MKVAVSERARALRAELEELRSHPWAGDYYAGDGIGENLSLLISESSFVITAPGCLGMYARAYGTVEANSERAVLHYEFQEGFLLGRGFPEELVIVQWEDRVYLIPPDMGPAFLDDVRAGVEPRSRRLGLHLLRTGYRSSIPAPPRRSGLFEELFELGPESGAILARILEVHGPTGDELGGDVFEVHLDSGTSCGFCEGMPVVVREQGDDSLPGTIEELGEDWARATFTRSKWRSEAPAPRPGWHAQRNREDPF